MSWNKIVGNERVKRILQIALLNKKVPHSYLFIGNDGVGKDACAIQIAKILNCKNPIINNNSIDCCEQCNNCISINNFSNPNFEIIFPLPSTNEYSSNTFSDALIEEIKSQLELKSQNHYHKIKIKNGNFIRVNTIREIKRKLSLSSFTYETRVILISEAEKMNTEAANAFLKTLEEPNPNTLIILTSSNPNLILDTIKSRCQIIKFSPIPESLITKFLVNKYNLEENNAKIIASLSDGSLSNAIDNINEKFIELENLTIELLRTSLKKKNFRKELYQGISYILENYDKNDILKLFKILIFWLKDAENYKYDKEKFKSNKYSNNYEKFINNFSTQNYLEIINFIDDAILYINRNVILSGIVIKLFLQIRHYLIQ